jgi:hypothetical protein
MRRNGVMRRLRLLIPAGVLLQLTACFGPDPQFFFTSVLTNALATNVIGAVINAISGALTAAPAG